VSAEPDFPAPPRLVFLLRTLLTKCPEYAAALTKLTCNLRVLLENPYANLMFRVVAERAGASRDS
jgi:hypothetical protein